MNGTSNDVSSLSHWFCGSSETGSSNLDLAIQVSAALTILMGLIQVPHDSSFNVADNEPFVQIGMSLLRLGFLAVLLSDQLVQGLTSGAAIYVMTIQVTFLDLLRD